MKFKKVTMFIGVFALAFTMQVSAQEISAEKKEVLNKFFQVMNVEDNYNQMMEMMLGQMQQGFIQAMDAQLADFDQMPQEKKDEVVTLMNGSMENIANQFSEFMVAEVPFTEISENIYLPMYDKYFEIADINGIIEFFESPIGQKFTKAVPEMMQEAMAKFNEQYQEKVGQGMMTIVQGEMAAVEPKLVAIIGEAAPAPVK